MEGGRCIRGERGEMRWRIGGIVDEVEERQLANVEDIER